MNNANKTGRKQKHFVNPLTGLPVVGLSRMTDGRWRVIGSHTRYSEPDVQKAIQKFYQLTGPVSKGEVAGVKINAKLADLLTLREQLLEIMRDNEAEYYKAVAADIIARPQYVAKQTGIEWIAYGPSLKPAETLPTADELRKLWEAHATCSLEQMKKVRKGWNHFVENTGLKSLGEITPELAIMYRDKLHASDYNEKTQAHLIGGIRRVLTNAKDRAVAMAEINKALTYLELLKPSGEESINDPKPLEVAEWKKLYAQAKTANDQALLLLCLNGSFYLQEAVNLEWGDIEAGCIVTSRKKTGKCIRVCVLWQETLEALAGMERKGDKIFITYAGLPIKASGAFRRFAEIRGDLKITPSQLRDSAYTAAVESGVSHQFCQLLNGHACGMADKYVKRNPQMVKPACDAVYRKYLA
jgi:integrase